MRTVENNKNAFISVHKSPRLSKLRQARLLDISRTSTRRITGRFKIGHRVL